MKNYESHNGFEREKQQEYETYLVEQHGQQAENLIKISKERVSKWTKNDWDEIKKFNDAVYKDLVNAITQRQVPHSNIVQAIILRHFQAIERFYPVSKEVYTGLADLYAQHPNFRNFFEQLHPEMINFIGEAMKFYAEQNL